MGQLDPFLHFDLSLIVGEVREMHHRCLWIDGLFQIVAGFYDHELYSGSAQLMVKWIAMRFLDDDFRFHPC